MTQGIISPTITYVLTYNNARLVPGRTFIANSEPLTMIGTEQTLPMV